MLAGTISDWQNIPAEWVEMINKTSLEKIKANARKIADLIVLIIAFVVAAAGQQAAQFVFG